MEQRADWGCLVQKRALYLSLKSTFMEKNNGLVILKKTFTL